MSELLEIDTKGMCLLCLGSGGPTAPKGTKRLSSTQGLKQLLRYLNVSTKDLFNCSPEFLQSMEMGEEIDVKITLCSDCTVVTEKFNKLYQEYEVIRLKFGDCVQTLHQSMKKGNENPERVRKYKDLMRSHKTTDMINASIAANLRNETFKKCATKLQIGSPKIIVRPSPSAGIFTLNNVPNLSGSVTQGADKPAVAKRRYQKRNSNSFEVTSRQGTPDKFHGMPQLNPIFDVGGDIAETADPDPVLASGKNTKRRKSSSVVNEVPPTAASTASSSTSSKCEFCDEVFEKKALHSHRLQIHADKLIMKHMPTSTTLPACRKGMVTVFGNFCKKISSEKGYTCPYCPHNTRWILRFRHHITLRHPEKFAGDILLHLKSNRQKPGPKPKSLVKRATATTTGKKRGRPFKLILEVPPTSPPTADASVPTSSDKKPKHKCPQCKKSYASIAQLNKHKVTHDKSFACQYCDRVFNTSASLKTHTLDTHASQIAMAFLPPESGITLDLCTQALKTIMERDSTPGGNCPKCDSKLGTSQGLNRHMLSVHLGDVMAELKTWLGVGTGDESFAYADPEEIIIPVDLNLDEGNGGESEMKVEVPLYFNESECDPPYEEYIE